MKIKYTKHGFVQFYENATVKKIVYTSKAIKTDSEVIQVNDGKLLKVEKTKFRGSYEVYFHNKPKKEHELNFCRAYHNGFGIPMSEDESKIFVVPWDDTINGQKVGFQAYDIETGTVLWRFPKDNIGDIYVRCNYIVVLQGIPPRASIFKLDINTGEIIAEIKSGTLEYTLDLGGTYILAESIKGKLSVVDVDDMSIVKNYGSIYKNKNINPSNCLSVLITTAIVQGGELIISGFEEHPNDEYNMRSIKGKPFTRVIDSDFNII